MSVSEWSGSMLGWEQELAALKERLSAGVRAAGVASNGVGFSGWAFVGCGAQDGLAIGGAGRS